MTVKRSASGEAGKKDSGKPNRREEILQVLAQMLETNPGERVTTAKLAARVGVTEAALYRHFPSKGKMFEGLVEFIEEAVFTRITRINQETGKAAERLQRILTLVLAFAEKNPGMCRIMMGDALAGEQPKLRKRAAHFFERLETELRQVLREAELNENLRVRLGNAAAANLLLMNVEGRIHQFVRSEFKLSPTAAWAAHWPVLAAGLFSTVSVPA
jgi:TetR/AcrR family transcriptional regulator